MGWGTSFGSDLWHALSLCLSCGYVTPRVTPFVEALRADQQVDLARAEPDDLSEQARQTCYEVHGQLYSRLRWRR